MNINPKNLKNGEPCNHPGCLNHVTHPCEGCRRIGGMPMKTIRLYRWPEEVTYSCTGCYFFKNYKCSQKGFKPCRGFPTILKPEKPEVDFIDVEIEEDAK